MKNRKVISHKQKLDAVFDKTKDLGPDPELIAHWSRYLCVLVSGFVEASVRTMIADYVTARSAPEVAHYVGRQVRQFSNAKMSKILALVAEFGGTLKDDLEVAVEGELKDAVDSVVSNRHLIAHGQDVAIGFAAIERYYGSAVKVVEEIEVLFST